MTAPQSDEGWKQYPYALGGEPDLVFPEAEAPMSVSVDRYAASGRVTGRTSGKSWAFFVELSGGRRWRTLHEDSCTLALFDLASGEYAADSTLDVPKLLRRRMGYRLRVGSGALDVAFHADTGTVALGARRGEDGAPLPFAYALRAEGRGRDGRALDLDLELQSTKPAIPVGGGKYAGAGTGLGQSGFLAYFQSRLALRGGLTWGDAVEEVDGDCGWIEHQWSPRPLPWRSNRFAYERRALHLDNGIEIALWTQIDRQRGDRVLPYSGATAAGPHGEVDATTAVVVETSSYARDPELVKPLRLREGPKYLASRARVTIPSWDLDLVCEPLVVAPALALLRDCWCGPTLLHGTLGGTAISGFGFHERTQVMNRDFELVEVLRQTLRHLPPATKPAPAMLADLAWELDAMISGRRNEDAIAFLEARIRPHLAALPEPDRTRLLRIADDTVEALLRWWVRPRAAD